MPDNSQSRKWQLTINNPQEHGITDELIQETLLKFVPDYYCMCREIGNETKTEHIHIFIYSKSPIRFTTLKNRFSVAHIEKAYGSIKDNIDYVRKTGKFADTDKAETTIEGSFYEYGSTPSELQEKDAVMGKLVEDVEDGKSNMDIVHDNPLHAKILRDIDYLRQTSTNEKYSKIFRDVTVTYLYGASGVGKTYSIFKNYDAENISRITNYTSSQGGLIFDDYDYAQDVLVFEEFHSQVPIENMLNFLDVYPLRLPARFKNKMACYTKIFITSNVPFENQYADYRMNLKTIAVYNAWCRRVHNIYEMVKEQDGSTKIIIHKETKKLEEFNYEK